VPAEAGAGSEERPAPAFVGYGHFVTDAQRAEWQDWMDGRAQEAYRRGCAAAEVRDFVGAAFWLGRANRMARDSPNVMFALGMVELARERWEEALALMGALAERFDLREAIGAKALCLLRLGRVGAARDVVGDLLGRFAPSPDVVPIADMVARGCGAVGWCGVSGRGVVTVACGRRVDVWLDGRRIYRGVGAGEHGLPPEWGTAGVLRVVCGGEDLLGSAVDLRAIRRVEGCVRATPRGIEGWVWHPGEAERAPVVRIHAPGFERVLVVEAFAEEVSSEVPIARPRWFSVARGRLPEGVVEVLDGNGDALTGSPLDPWMGILLGRGRAGVPERFRPCPVGERPVGERSVRRRRREERGLMIVIPVHADFAVTRACLKSVLETRPEGVEVLVVDDATPEPGLARWLDRLAGRGAVTLWRHERAQGFPASVNLGMGEAEGRDVILLNSDTLVPPGWCEALRAAAYSAADVGTVTPLSNRASILSYPALDRANPVPDLRMVRRMAALCVAENGGEVVEIPTANGFCMYIRGDCLAETGFMREDVFAQGYGEENAFCMKARGLGWRHVAALGMYVGHVGSASFRAAGVHLMRRNQEILEALYPGYGALVRDHVARDPLFAARRRLDLARLRMVRGRRGSVVLVLHDGGGGVARVARERAAVFAAEGVMPLVLKPDPLGCVLSLLEGTEDFPNLRFVLPEESGALVAVLRACGVRGVEWHHLVGHAPWVRELHRDLGVPYDVFIHDYVWFCQRISLLGIGDRYCGEPDPAGCEVCVARCGSYLGEAISVAGLLERSGRELRGARRLMTPSGDCARRMMRHFPGIVPEVLPLEDDRAWPAVRPLRALGGKRARRRVCIVGGIGREKGYDVVRALAEDARARDLPLEFSLVGHTPGDEALMETGRVVVTGEYRDGEAQGLIAAQDADLGLIPSITAETWCYALGQVWRAGLPALAFDLGAQGARIRDRGAGWVVPLGMPAAAMNDWILRLG